MKRYLAILVLLPLLAMGGRQQGMGPGPGMPASSGGGCANPFSDSFSGSGALSSCWSVVASVSGSYYIVQASGVATQDTDFASAMEIVSGGSFPRNQYAQYTITTDVVADGPIAQVCVEMSTSGNGYCYGTSGMSKYTAGSSTRIDPYTCPTTFAAGNVIEISITSAGVITGYLNGTAGCTVTDTTYTSGYPGMYFSASHPTGLAVSSFSAGTF